MLVIWVHETGLGPILIVDLCKNRLEFFYKFSQVMLLEVTSSK